MWKGDKIGYTQLHSWVRNNFFPKPILCEICGIKKPYDLANKTGIYARSFDNWCWLCRRCHVLSDGRMMNLVQYRRYSAKERSLFGKKAQEQEKERRGGNTRENDTK